MVRSGDDTALRVQLRQEHARFVGESMRAFHVARGKSGAGLPQKLADMIRSSLLGIAQAVVNAVQLILNGGN